VADAPGVADGAVDAVYGFIDGDVRLLEVWKTKATQPPLGTFSPPAPALE
jgi:hypothetical protein